MPDDSDNDNSVKEIMMISLDSKNIKGSVQHKKRKIIEINKISKVDFDARIRPQNTEGVVITFGPTDATRVEPRYSQNLIVQLNIHNYLIHQVLIDPAADISILYFQAFKAMNLPLSTLNVPEAQIRSLNSKLSTVLGTIKLHVKLVNEIDGFVKRDELFYVIDVASRYNAIMSNS